MVKKYPTCLKNIKNLKTKGDNRSVLSIDRLFFHQNHIFSNLAAMKKLTLQVLPDVDEPVLLLEQIFNDTGLTFLSQFC
jgi:hypothetical protein